MNEEHKLAATFKRTASQWRRFSICLTSIYYILGTIAVVFSMIVASKPTYFGGPDADYSNFAFLSAVFTAVLAFLPSKETAFRYWTPSSSSTNCSRSTNATRPISTS